jgi:drug/metabolite transporter (DMT)-like permease
MPLWSAFFDAIWPGGKTPLTWRIGVGLAIGFLGSALLAGITPHELATADLRGPIALTFGSACWALGSVYWKRNPTEVSPYAAAAVQMAIAGAILCVVGLALGEAADFHLRGTGLAAMAYLVVFGSLVGYTAFGYALEHGSATVVGTYAYVNPVVAVLLGWLVLHEPITGRMLTAMALILGAVVWIQLAARPAGARSAEPVRALRRRYPADA